MQALSEELGAQIDENQAAEVRKALAELLGAAGEVNIPSPASYYALLHMDGDHMGRWLSGTHDKLTTFAGTFHPKVQEELSIKKDWGKVLNQRRLMAPSLHATISEALAGFALRLVRLVVEERHLGRVVYAGGDDVLALLPLSDSLAAARELRALFSGEVELTEPNLKPWERDICQHNWHPAFTSQNCTGYLVVEARPLVSMGPGASASVGMAIVHHRYPLDAALRAMRDAERAAKEDYGRNALCVYLLKRSGEESRLGAAWSYPEIAVDTVDLVSDLAERFRRGERGEEGGISMRLAYILFQEAHILANLPRGAQQAELCRLLSRHMEGFPSEEVEKEAQQLANRLGAFAKALDQPGEREGLVRMARWVLFARFLAKGGGE